MKPRINTNIFSWILPIILVGIYGVFSALLRPVQPIHEWRKTDSFSIAWNYMNQTEFLNPQTNAISFNGNRAAASEFPIAYYSIGKIWSLFGHHEFIGNLITVVLFLISLILFVQSTRLQFKSQIKTMVFTGMILSSPVLISYLNSIIPNIHSLTLLLLTAYFTSCYLETKKRIFWYLLTISLTLAVLIKITALIAVITFASAAFCHYLFTEKTLWKKHKSITIQLMSSLCIMGASIIAWYSYVIFYNDIHKSTLFLTTIRPIWEVETDAQHKIWTMIWYTQINNMYHAIVFIPSVMLLCYLVVNGRVQGFLAWLLGIGFAGVIAYVSLWYCAFEHHDYYLIEIIFFPAIIFYILILKFEFILTRFAVIRKILTAVFLSVFFFQAYAQSQMIHGNSSSNWFTENILNFHDRFELWSYFHYYHKYHLGQLQNHRAEIETLISPSDTVFCVSDASPNTHLYTIQRIGFSQHSLFSNENDSAEVARLIQKGASKMLQVGKEPLDSTLNAFTKDTLFAADGVYIFQLK